jgi:hypothetical protein
VKERLLFAALPFAAGVLVLVFHRQFAALQIRSQNQLWGFRFGPREEAINRFVNVIVGICLLLYGFIGLAGFVPVRR